MVNITEVLNVAESLDQKELEILSSKILQMLRTSSGSLSSSSHSSDVCACRKCSSSAILKYGKDKNGKQRYKCKSCGAIFYETSYSVISKTRHDTSVWQKYIELWLKRASLYTCAKACNISVQTAFVWRHKILHALLSR